MVASHTEKPLGFSKWLVKATPHTYTLLLCKGQELTMSPTIKAGYVLRGLSFSSHFAVPIGTAVWLATFVWCLWHHYIRLPRSCSSGCYPGLVAQCPSRAYTMGICQIIFEFWPQKMGGIGHEKVIRSKKRQFLRFFVTYWTTDDYTNVNLSSDGLEIINLRKVRFRCTKDHVSCGET